MSFWNKKNQSDSNKEPEKEEVTSEPLVSGASPMFDILETAAQLVEGAGGLPVNNQMHHADGASCENAECPFYTINDPKNMQAWFAYYSGFLGDDFVIGQVTPDGNPIVRYLRSCIPANLELDTSKMITSREGLLFIIHADMSGVTVYEHELPEWVKRYIDVIIADAESSGEPDLTVSQAQAVLARL